MVTKTMPVRPVNMGHAVEQTGQSLASRLFNSTVNAGKAVVVDLPVWCFTKHPYIAGLATIGALFGIYMYKGGSAMWKTTPELKQPADKPADSATLDTLNDQMEPLQADVDAAKDKIVAAKSDLDDFADLSNKNTEKVNLAKAALDQAAKDYDDYNKKVGTERDISVLGEFLAKKNAAGKAYKDTAAVIIPKTKEELNVIIARLEIAKNKAELAVSEHNLKIAVLKGKTPVPSTK